jgi:hypothetical protein
MSAPHCAITSSLVRPTVTKDDDDTVEEEAAFALVSSLPADFLSASSSFFPTEGIPKAAKNAATSASGNGSGAKDATVSPVLSSIDGLYSSSEPLTIKPLGLLAAHAPKDAGSTWEFAPIGALRAPPPDGDEVESGEEIPAEEDDDALAAAAAFLADAYEKYATARANAPAAAAATGFSDDVNDVIFS